MSNTKQIKSINGLSLQLVTNYGAIGYMILNEKGVNVLGYVYQGTEKSALRILAKRAMKNEAA